MAFAHHSNRVMRCEDCGMVFGSSMLLRKHQSRFCLGPDGQPWYKVRGRSAEVAPVNRLVVDKSRTDLATPEEEHWEERAASLRKIRKGSGRKEKKKKPNEPQKVSSRDSLSSQSLQLDLADDSDDDDSRAKQEINTQRRIDAHMHDVNMSNLRERNRLLEKQRDEIDAKLAAMQQPQPVLDELRRFEAANQAHLQELKGQLDSLRLGSALKRRLKRKERLLAGEDEIEPEVIEVKSAFDDVIEDELLPQQFLDPDVLRQYVVAWLEELRKLLKAEKTEIDGFPLVSEIKAMRASYLRQGGNDPGLLAQMADMETEALALEAKQREKKVRINEQISSYERENRRLQDTVYQLQDRNDRRMRDNGASQAVRHELRRTQDEYGNRFADLQRDLDNLRKNPPAQALYVVQQPQKQEFSNPPTQSVTTRPTEADMPVLLQHPLTLPESDPLAPAPYDEEAGFVIFYDYVMGMEPFVHSCRLVVGLFNHRDQQGEPTTIPPVYCYAASPAFYAQTGPNMAIIGARQPVPRCPATRDLSLIVELQTAVAGSNRLLTKAWVKVELFDAALRLLSGRWRAPFRVTPIRPDLSQGQVMALPQQGMVDIFYRLVNLRDADAQAAMQVDPSHAHLYNYTPQLVNYLENMELPPLGVGDVRRRHWDTMPFKEIAHAPAVVERGGPAHSPISPNHARRSPVGPVYRDFDYNRSSHTIGFQVDKVKRAESGEAKVRLTAYYTEDGKALEAGKTPVTCSTSAVRDSYRHNMHVFGQQEATFHDIRFRGNVVLIARLYLRKRAVMGLEELPDAQPVDSRVFDDETLVAWSAMPLINMAARAEVSVGTHKMALYEPPVPDPELVPMEPHWQPKDWRRYRDATVRIHIFQETARPGSLTPSIQSEAEMQIPDETWLPFSRSKAPTEPYTSMDGFDVYIDGCRFLPDNVTVTRIAARILDRNYEKIGKDMSATAQLDSDIYNPVFNYRVEIREPNIEPSATLLLKIYTLNKFTKELQIGGYATLKIFVETGTEKQPSVNSGGVQVSLNEGAHQVRLFQRGPNGVDPITERCILDTGARFVPCASALLRLIKAPVGPQGRPLEANNVPQVDWQRLGLVRPRPTYEEGGYLSLECTPTRGETLLLHTQVRRPRVSVREALRLVADESEQKAIRSDKAAEAWIRSHLIKLIDMQPKDLELTHVAEYSPQHGLKVALDNASNLPWSNFTHATLCFNPPAAFYTGQSNSSYDRLAFTEDLDLNSTNKSPGWKDGYKTFTARTFHRFMCLVIHLQEIQVTVDTENYRYGLVEQGWTAMQVFDDNYANTDVYQLPLLAGAPTEAQLRAMSREPCINWLKRSINNGGVKVLDNASVFIRIADGRRDDELPDEISDKMQIDVRTEYLPPGKERLYEPRLDGKQLSTLVPQDKLPDHFVKGLATKFKSLVYKLHEEGGLTKA